jgi:hypothetical protein
MIVKLLRAGGSEKLRLKLTLSVAPHYNGFNRLAFAGKGGMELDDNLKELLKNLGQAINESVGESDKVAEAINDIHEAGYDVFMILEATIGFHHRDEENASAATEFAKLPSGELTLTSQDAQFLKSLRIRTEPGLDDPFTKR